MSYAAAKRRVSRRGTFALSGQARKIFYVKTMTWGEAQIGPQVRSANLIASSCTYINVNAERGVYWSGERNLKGVGHGDRVWFKGPGPGNSHP
jgi:hypothetical protein